MDPDNRLMLQVSIDDAEEADRLFDVLMGNEVEPRRRFIQTHAKKKQQRISTCSFVSGGAPHVVFG